MKADERGSEQIAFLIRVIRVHPRLKFCLHIGTCRSLHLCFERDLSVLQNSEFVAGDLFEELGVVEHLH